MERNRNYAWKRITLIQGIFLIIQMEKRIYSLRFFNPTIIPARFIFGGTELCASGLNDFNIPTA